VKRCVLRLDLNTCGRCGGSKEKIEDGTYTNKVMLVYVSTKYGN